jgi:type VI secretion system (T6SS) effector TldE1-like protein
MTYATRSAAGRSVPRRRARGLAVGAIAVTTLIAPVLLLAAVGALSTSLAAHSGGQGTRGLEMALRADPYGRYAGAGAGAGVPGWPDRLIDPVDPQDMALAAQDDVTGSVPVDAGVCARAASLVSPMPTAGDLAFAGRGALAGPPCLTVAETRATALVATRMLVAPNTPVRLASLMPPDTAMTDVPAAVVPPAPQPADTIAPPASRPRGDQERDDTILRASETRTAIYDISARTVYLPDGRTLEAHSGLGRKMDDPRFVHVRMQGATPPNVYDLRLREALFHGVQAIRLTPVSGSRMFGRDGMLAHSYLLGPNGQSHGCVSFRNYPAFLQAFLKGEVKRMVVVARLEAPPPHAVVARGADRNRVALKR